MHFQPGLVINAAMLARVCSTALNGIEAYPVEVEVNAGWGDTLIVIVVNKAFPAGSNTSRTSLKIL